MKDSAEVGIWENDLLGYEKVGETFTRLVKSIDQSRVISIEAGYGRGKTFFRQRWAMQLEAVGETVVEIDAHLADHSGDPVLTFIGALIGKLPKGDKPKVAAAFAKGKEIVGVLARTVGGIAARQGAGALIDYVSGELQENLEGHEEFQKHLDAVSEGVSKKAGTLIAAQIEAERVRTTDLHEQMKALRAALTGEDPAVDPPQKRVVVLVDELDRCHPDYAIAFLEAMKLVFAHDGFVFCLMVNAEYLEGLAAQRFGKPEQGERYLDKFVDIRLALPLTDQVLSGAVQQLFLELPEGTPFGDAPAFSMARAAELAGELAVRSGLSMRLIKRVRLKVELALRCYSDQPLDYSLLVLLAFHQIAGTQGGGNRITLPNALLSRSNLTAKAAAELQQSVDQGRVNFANHPAGKKLAHTHCRELIGLPDDRYHSPDDQNYYDWVKICLHLGPRYIPDHEAVLNALAQYEVGKTE